MAETTRGTCPTCGQGQSARTDQAEVTSEEFAGMNVARRDDLYRTNPDLYRKLAGR